MNQTPSERRRGFAEDTRGNVAIIFGFALVPILFFIGATVDYEKLQADRAKLQTGTDQAALYVAGAVSSYMQQNGGSYPPTATIATYKTQAEAVFSANTSGFGALSSANLHVCTPSSGDCSMTVHNTSVTLTNGQVAATASGSQSQIFSNLLGGATNVSVTSTAGIKTNTTTTSTTSAVPSPATIKYDFQYAKGWYYKVVTLYAVPANSSTPTALATWTYQATNTSNVAIPPSALNLQTTSGFPSNPSDTGTGYVTAWYAPNTVLDTDGSTILLNQTKDSTGTVTFATYSSIYLTMQVNDGQCAPGMNYNQVSQSMGNDGFNGWNWFTQHYHVDNNNDAQQINVGCTGTASSNPTWSLTESTNSAAHSDYIWINGSEQPASTVMPLLTAFPCPADPTPGQTATNYYSWEDSNTAASGDRDFFFSLTTTCSQGNWTNAPTTTTTSSTTTTTPVLMR